MKPHLSKRSSQVLASPIRKFLPLVLAAERNGTKVFKLNVGDPDITPPADFLRTIKKYKPATVGYAPSPGILEHTKAWADYYAKFGVKVNPQNIIPTVGCAEAMLLSMIAATDPGDEILVFEPLYTSYKGFASSISIKLVPVTLKLENNFALPPKSEIVKKITKKTKAILLINPGNPNGKAFSTAEIKTIADIAIKHNLLILSDETYREIVFNTQPTTLLKLPQIHNRLIVMDSASKRFSLPGARIGCLVSTNPSIHATLLRLAMIRLSAPTLEQYGLVPLLKNSKPYTAKITKEYKKRRDIVVKALNKMPGVICQSPQGAFYLMARLPLKDSEDFIKFLITKFRYQNKTVILAPAREFYVTKGLGQNEIRIAYVLGANELKQALTVLTIALKKYCQM